MNAELEPYRTLHLLNCPKSTKHTRTFESRQFDRQSTVLFLKHVWSDFKDEMILFTKRDQSSKEAIPPLIVGLREPQAYRVQQEILAGANRLGYDDKITLPPARQPKEPINQPQQKIAIHKDDVKWFH